MRDLCFDSSGTYLAVAGSDVRVYLCKQWNELKVSNVTVVMLVTSASSGMSSRSVTDGRTAILTLSQASHLRMFFIHPNLTFHGVQVLSEHTAMATGVRFGPHCQFLASTSMDRTLKVYGSP